MQVRCTHCGKVLASPSAGAIHVRNHPSVKRSGRSTWGSDYYVDGERWDAYSARTDPPDRAQKATKTGGNSPVLEPTISQHVGADWETTACLCGCHYLKGCDEKECV